MKALTLTQPWASLVALGAKTVETRSWRTPYRGPLAIHAAKGFPKEEQRLSLRPEFADALRFDGDTRSLFHVPDHIPGGRQYAAPEWLPRGEVIAVCRLVDIVPTSRVDMDTKVPRGERWRDCLTNTLIVGYDEWGFGDYAAGRFAWLLEDVQPLPAPVPAKGALGLWEWDEKGLAG